MARTTRTWPELPAHGQVGVVRFFNKTVHQKTMLNMEHVEKLILYTPGNEEAGPDLAFLKLPEYAAGALEARSSFFNLTKPNRKEELVSEKRKPGLYMDALFGIIGEWTKELATEAPKPRLKSICGLFGVGYAKNQRTSDSFDYTDFETTHDEVSPAPKSFGGMSGGSLWNVSLNKDETGEISATTKQIIGVAFYESSIDENKKRVITCHGPKSLYDILINKIQSRWPE
jgi:hypothetical protein